MILSRSSQHLQVSSNFKHDSHFWGKFSKLWTFCTSIINVYFLNKKCRHHCPEANHVLTFHLSCLSDENFEVEVSEKIRLDFVPFKIRIHIWLIVLVSYISGIVMKIRTTFMFTILIFVEKWVSYRWSGWREVEDEVQAMKTFCNIILWFWF